MNTFGSLLLQSTILLAREMNFQKQSTAYYLLPVYPVLLLELNNLISNGSLKFQ